MTSTGIETRTEGPPMVLSVVRLALVAFWLAVAAALFLRHRLPAELGDQVADGGYSLDVGALLAVALAGWNLMRWFTARNRWVPPEDPLGLPRTRVVRTDDRPFEYNPELDFTKQDRP